MRNRFSDPFLLFSAAVCLAGAPSPAQEPGTRQPTAGKPAEATAEAAAEPEAEPKAPQQIPYLRPSGRYVDLAEMGFSPLDLLGGPTQTKSFFAFRELLEGLADRDETECVLDLTGGASFNLPQLRELERSIAKVRDAGKRIVCYVQNAGPGAYQLASQCDRILMADMGMVDLCSPAMNVMHFKDALDLLGVQVEVTRVGEFKGAVEPFMLPKMSDHLRDHYEAMLTSINEDIVRRIATGRRLDPAKVRELQAQRLFTAEDALLNGLVDRLVPWTGAKRAIASLHGDEPFELVDAAPKKRKQRRDIMSLFSSLLRQNDEEEIESPQIVVMHLAGQIVDGDKPVPGSMVSGPSVEAIDRLADNDLVKGVVVRINSPGGSATASEAIRQALLRLAAAKPVVFSMGELAASGGYWITAIGRPILAEVGTITGSIGVFGMRFQPGAMMRRIGVHSDIVRLDDGPLMDAIDRPWSDEARERVQGFVDDVYDRFLEHVAGSRDKTVEQVDAIAGGRVWSGQQAVHNGLVDRIGGLDEAIAVVRQQSSLGSDVEVLHLPEPKNFADALFASMFESGIAATTDDATLRKILDRCGRLGEVVGILHAAVQADGATNIYALMPPGLRLR